MHSCLYLHSLKTLSQVLEQSKGHLFISPRLQFLNNGQAGKEQNCSAEKTRTHFLGFFKAPCPLAWPHCLSKAGLRQRGEGMELQGRMCLSMQVIQ